MKREIQFGTVILVAVIIVILSLYYRQKIAFGLYSGSQWLRDRAAWLETLFQKSGNGHIGTGATSSNVAASDLPVPDIFSFDLPLTQAPVVLIPTPTMNNGV